MTPDDIAAKLHLITKLTAAELPGYEAAARQRGMFDGEIAAIMERKIHLKIKPKGR